MNANSKKRILILDDDNDFTEFLKDRLRYEGYEVTCGDNGKIGLKLVKKFQPHLILLDLKMPVLNGVEFLQKLKKKRIDLPILIITSYKEMLNGTSVDKFSVQGILEKPVEVERVVEVVKNI